MGPSSSTKVLKFLTDVQILGRYTDEEKYLLATQEGERKLVRQKKREFEKQQVQLFAAIKNGDMSIIEHLLSSDSDINLLQIKDNDGNTLLHHAAMAGNFSAFCRLLQYLCTKDTASAEVIFQQLKQCRNKKGRSPWHLAAAYGYSDFFDLDKLEEALDADSLQDKDINQILGVMADAWLNAGDNQGNTPLHFAAAMEPNVTYIVLKNKKRVIAKLKKIPTLNLNAQNNKLQTALHIAAKMGNYSGARELLKAQKSKVIRKKKEKDEVELKIINQNDLSLKDFNENTAGNLSSKFKHDRVRKLIEYYSTRKSIDGKSKHNDAFTVGNAEILAENIHAGIDEVVRAVKLFIDDYDNARIKKLAEMRMEKLHKKNRFRMIWTSFFGAACSAFTLGTMAGTFGGAFESIIVGAVFLVTFFPFVYASYVTAMEQNRQEAELLYLSCASVKIQSIQDKMTVKSMGIVKQLDRIDKAIEHSSSKVELTTYQNELTKLHGTVKELREQKQQLDQFYEFSTSADKKPKIKLQFLSQDKYNKKKMKAIDDPGKASEWATRKERIISFITYKADVLCTTGALIDLFGIVASVVLNQVGIGFLSAGFLAGMLGGPIGIAIVTLIGTLALATLVGVMLYKATYVGEKEEAGERNRDLVFAHDACRHADYQKMSKLYQGVERRLDQSANMLECKRTEIAKTGNTAFSLLKTVSSSPIFSRAGSLSNSAQDNHALEVHSDGGERRSRQLISC